MSDPNRERWEQEAEEERARYSSETAPCQMYGQERCFIAGYLTACEKYAPRWVDTRTAEFDQKVNSGWFQTGFHPVFWSLLSPPAPPPPGGEE